MSISNETRIKLERRIVRTLIQELAAAGYLPVKVWDGGEYVAVSALDETMDAVFAVDDSTIHFAPKDKPEEWGRRGVLIIGGNGEDIISDWHCGDKKFSEAVDAAANVARESL